MGYHQNGVYYLIREANIKISEHFQSKNKTLTELCNFFYILEVRIAMQQSLFFYINLAVFNDIGVLGRYSGCVKDTQRRA